MASTKLTPLPFPLPKPFTPSPPLSPFKFPFPSLTRLPKTLTLAFYTERTPISDPPPKPRSPNPSDPDDISILNQRIRRELGKRNQSPNSGGGGGERSLDSKEAEKYIKLVKQQQQRGLQKLRGRNEGDGGFGYRVDPYTLQPGDYVVHKKVGIGKFVAIKYDVPAGEVTEPVEYVFIEYGDGMAKLPVKQAAKMLYRYNL